MVRGGRGLWMLGITVVAALLFLPGLGAVHLFDWDEINFAEIAREMITTGDHLRPQIDYQPFWEKPPLFIWMQVVSMRWAGVNAFAARLPNAVCGILALLVLFRIGDMLRGKGFGLLWVLAYMGSILPHLYFRSGIIDPWFNLLIFLALYFFILLTWGDPARTEGMANRERGGYAAASGLFLGLAILTKGPVALLLAGLTISVVWAMGRFRPMVGRRSLMVFVITTILVASSWFIIDLVRNGPWFVVTFIKYQWRLFSTPDAGHGGFPGYHFVVLLLGCFPASLFAVRELLKPLPGDPHQKDFRRWMVVLLCVVLVLFTLVKSKIVHYSSLAYYPLTYLAALNMQAIWRGGRKAGIGLRIAIGLVGGVFALASILLPVVGMHPELIKPYFAMDAFAMANLEAPVVWTGWETLAGVWLLLTLAFSIFWLEGNDRRWGLLTLFGGTAVYVALALMVSINKIEGYSQNAAITFFQQRQGERCYVITKGYKSYAQFFYTRKPPATDARAHDEEWLLHGAIDRPVYIVTKVTSADEVRRIPGVEELYTANGFVFFERKVP
ncbi:MAG: glycosyltransferase family 39 protein [Flavobacteriales bacterium]|nr:glycosyltransferase family 39 protein [Flavobacteriales bacterium]MCB9170447.1 glycosyltransferase family 39 protein [Flavobacteriales bacterium]